MDMRFAQGNDLEYLLSNDDHVRPEVLRDKLSGDGRPFRVDLPRDAAYANAAMGARVENVNGYWPVALPQGRLQKSLRLRRGFASNIRS